MIANTKVHGELSKNDIEKIVKAYLEAEGYKNADIYFNVTMQEDKDDYFSERALSPVFKNITFVCNK